MAMAIDVTATRSRRALLAAAIGGLAASAAHALGRPTAALATDGQPVVQGADNSGSASTLVRSSTTTAFQGLADAATGAHFGVRGRSSSTSGIGMYGVAAAGSGSTIGVYGTGVSPAGTGVKGEAPLRGVEGIATATTGGAVGVRAVTNAATGFGLAAENVAIADDATAIGCQAQGVAIHSLATGIVGKGLVAAANSPTGETVAVDGAVVSPSGIGVRGVATTGVGVHGQANSAAGTGLKVTGKAVFSRSGKATVQAGQSTVMVSSVTITAASLVLATIQGVGESGLYVKSVSVSVSNSRFTIRLSKAVAANTLVGWFIVN
jgi:hypothetical protein